MLILIPCSLQRPKYVKSFHFLQFYKKDQIPINLSKFNYTTLKPDNCCYNDNMTITTQALAKTTTTITTTSATNIKILHKTSLSFQPLLWPCSIMVSWINSFENKATDVHTIESLIT